MESLGEPFVSAVYKDLDGLYETEDSPISTPTQAVNEHWRTQLLRAIEARENKANAMDQNAEADKARWGAIALREFLEGMK